MKSKNYQKFYLAICYMLSKNSFEAFLKQTNTLNRN